MAYISTLFLNGITYAGLLFVVASGLTLVYGLMRVVNMAHGSLYITGACLGYMIYKALGNHWAFAFLGAGVALTIICFFLQLLVYDRAFNQPALGVLLSLGISAWLPNTVASTRSTTRSNTTVSGCVSSPVSLTERMLSRPCRSKLEMLWKSQPLISLKVLVYCAGIQEVGISLNRELSMEV